MAEVKQSIDQLGKSQQIYNKQTDQQVTTWIKNRKLEPTLQRTKSKSECDLNCGLDVIKKVCCGCLTLIICILIIIFCVKFTNNATPLFLGITIFICFKVYWERRTYRITWKKRVLAEFIIYAVCAVIVYNFFNLVLYFSGVVLILYYSYNQRSVAWKLFHKIGDQTRDGNRPVDRHRSGRPAGRITARVEILRPASQAS